MKRAEEEGNEEGEMNTRKTGRETVKHSGTKKKTVAGKKKICKCIINKHSLLTMRSTSAKTQTYASHTGNASDSAGLGNKHGTFNAEKVKPLM